MSKWAVLFFALWLTMLTVLTAVLVNACVASKWR
jgi:hypothetical protein